MQSVSVVIWNIPYMEAIKDTNKLARGKSHGSPGWMAPLAPALPFLLFPSLLASTGPCCVDPVSGPAPGAPPPLQALALHSLAGEGLVHPLPHLTLLQLVRLCGLQLCSHAIKEALRLQFL